MVVKDTSGQYFKEEFEVLVTKTYFAPRGRPSLDWQSSRHLTQKASFELSGYIGVYQSLK